MLVEKSPRFGGRPRPLRAAEGRTTEDRAVGGGGAANAIKNSVQTFLLAAGTDGEGERETEDDWWKTV